MGEHNYGSNNYEAEEEQNSTAEAVIHNRRRKEGHTKKEAGYERTKRDWSAHVPVVSTQKLNLG